MSVIAVQPITLTNPEEKCVICQYSQAETPNQEWVGHSLSEKIIENGKEIEKLKWAHNFHRECLVETAKTGYSLCPGACGNTIDPSSLHSRAERAVILARKVFKHAVIGSFLWGGAGLTGVAVIQRTGNNNTGLAAILAAGFSTFVYAVEAAIRTERWEEVALGVSVAPVLLGALVGGAESGLCITIVAVGMLITTATLNTVTQALGISHDELRSSFQAQSKVWFLVVLLALMIHIFY